MKCKQCGEEFEAANGKVYCNVKCSARVYYLKNKKSIIAKTKKWGEDNPVKARINSKKSMNKYRQLHHAEFNASVLRSYYRNKFKWNARSSTHQVLGLKKNPPKIDKFCRNCGTKDDVKLKFEVYHKKFKDIRKAFEDKKIYYLCGRCRREVKKNV